MTTCSTCGAPHQPAGARFCFACGAALGAPRCGSCQAEVMPGARFCSSCGAAQDGVSSAQAQGPVASRRITSVLFGDLVGFTTLSEARDQEEVRELLSAYFDECRQIIARYGGTVEKFIGDAVMAVWGVPTAHEDDAERAVRAGLELVSRIESLGADLGVRGLAMRAGIVTGEVAVTIGAQQQGMVAGDAVNTAARVQSAAAPGQVWVDETTRLLTTSAISYVDVGSHELKGKAEPVPLWSVRAVVAAVGGAQRADGLEAPHIGREREMRLVKELFHGVEETGRPALLVVDGDPGVGKTRLAWEFDKYADGLSNVTRWHEGRCLAYGEGVAFYALAEAIRGRLRNAQDTHDDEEIEEDPAQLLAQGLERYVPDPDERAWLGPRLGALLGVEAVVGFAKEDLFSAWTTFLERVGEGRYPVVLMIDDAQHADDGLLMFLEYLLGVATFPCFVVLLARPGLLQDHGSLATNRRVTVLHLEPLGDAEIGCLLDGLVVGLPDGVRESLVERAEGVPLFAVETVRSLIDRDLVVPRGGQYVLADPALLDLDSLGAPASLQALIAARLDTLGARARRVIDQASVLGHSFSRDAIARLCPDVEDLGAELAGLVRLQLLRQDSSRFSTELGQYQFVQGAVRQVAYGTLSRRDRKAGHLEVVRMLEEQDDAGGERASVVAQHLLEALDAVPDDPDADELATRAIAHLERAATRASSLGAPAEAAGHLQLAHARCADQARATRIEADLARALVKSGDYPAAAEHAAHARDGFDAAGDPVSAGAATATMCGALLWSSGAFWEVLEIARERYAMLEGRADAGEAQLALTDAMVGAMVRLGKEAEDQLREMADRQAQLADRVGSDIDLANGYLNLAFHYGTQGPTRLGRIMLESAAAIGREHHDARLLTRALSNLNAATTQDDVQAAAEVGREAVEVARTTGEPMWLTVTMVNYLLARMWLDDWDAVIEMSAEEAFESGPVAFAELVRSYVFAARGEQEWEPLPGFTPEQQPQDDHGLLAARAAVAAVRALVGGRPSDAAAAALAAVSTSFQMNGLYDDFTLTWAICSDVVWAAGDRAALDGLFAVAARDLRNRPPTGLRAQQERMRGLCAIADQADPAIAEGHLRSALALARQWRSPVMVARVQADLGAWLVREGDPDRLPEAEDLVAAARATYARLGATAWTRQLDGNLAGART